MILVRFDNLASYLFSALPRWPPTFNLQISSFHAVNSSDLQQLFARTRSPFLELVPSFADASLPSSADGSITPQTMWEHFQTEMMNGRLVGFCFRAPISCSGASTNRFFVASSTPKDRDRSLSSHGSQPRKRRTHPLCPTEPDIRWKFRRTIRASASINRPERGAQLSATATASAQPSVFASFFFSFEETGENGGGSVPAKQSDSEPAAIDQRPGFDLGGSGIGPGHQSVDVVDAGRKGDGCCGGAGGFGTERGEGGRFLMRWNFCCYSGCLEPTRELIEV